MATASSPRKKCKPSQSRSKKSGRCRKKPCSPGKTRDVFSRLCRKKKCGSGKTRDAFSLRCRKKRSRSPKRSSRKSPKTKSPKRKSLKRKSPKRKSPKRKSPTTKSRSRKQPCNKPGQTRSRKSKRCRVPPCKDGMIRNKKSGNCRKKCLPGQYRSRSGRCKLIGSSSTKRKSPLTKSRSTKSRSTKSRSRKSPCKKPGQTRSRKSKRCRVPPCKDGMIRNKKSGNCRKKCLPGQYRSRSGRCKLIGSGSGLGSSSSSSAFGFKSGAGSNSSSKSSSKTALDDGLARLGVAMPDPMKLFTKSGIIPPGIHGFVPKAADGRKLHSADSAHLATVKSKHKSKHNTQQSYPEGTTFVDTEGDLFIYDEDAYVDLDTFSKYTKERARLLNSGARVAEDDLRKRYGMPPDYKQATLTHPYSVGTAALDSKGNVFFYDNFGDVELVDSDTFRKYHKEQAQLLKSGLPPGMDLRRKHGMPPYYKGKLTSKVDNSHPITTPPLPDRAAPKKSSVLAAVRNHDEDRMIKDPSHPISRLSSDPDAYPLAYPLVYPLAYPVTDDTHWKTTPLQTPNRSTTKKDTPAIERDLNEFAKWRVSK